MQLTEKNDIKIFILYLLMNIEYPIDMTTLSDISVQDDFVQQFDFMDCFFELFESGAIACTFSDGEQLYSITDSGRKAAEALQSEILPAIRQRSLKSAYRLLSFKKNGAVISAEVKKDGGDRYVVCVSIKNRSGLLMSASVAAENEENAEEMRRNFEEKPELIYRGMLSLLSGDVNYLA
ncbi:MAG: DUF4364 family protein [Clostridia bacterium]|nr:DUF4364 family protein [Clostridia bacterium]